MAEITSAYGTHTHHDFDPIFFLYISRITLGTITFFFYIILLNILSNSKSVAFYE